MQNLFEIISLLKFSRLLSTLLSSKGERGAIRIGIYFTPQSSAEAPVFYLSFHMYKFDATS